MYKFNFLNVSFDLNRQMEFWFTSFKTDEVHKISLLFHFYIKVILKLILLIKLLLKIYYFVQLKKILLTSS